MTNWQSEKSDARSPPSRVRSHRLLATSDSGARDEYENSVLRTVRTNESVCDSSVAD